VTKLIKIGHITAPAASVDMLRSPCGVAIQQMIQSKFQGYNSVAKRVAQKKRVKTTKTRSLQNSSYGRSVL